MNLARASKQIVYGQQRWRVLFAAVFFPLPLLWSLIGNIRLQGWTLGSASSLTACAGLYVSLITFLVAPIRCWWAFRIALGIIALSCAAWIGREALLFPRVQAPLGAWVFVLLTGAGSLLGMLRPAPDQESEKQYIPDKGFPQPVAWWISGLVYALLLLPILFSLRALYVMFR